MNRNAAPKWKWNKKIIIIIIRELCGNVKHPNNVQLFLIERIQFHPNHACVTQLFGCAWKLSRKHNGHWHRWCGSWYKIKLISFSHMHLRSIGKSLNAFHKCSAQTLTQCCRSMLMIKLNSIWSFLCARVRSRMFGIWYVCSVCSFARATIQTEPTLFFFCRSALFVFSIVTQNRAAAIFAFIKLSSIN